MATTGADAEGVEVRQEDGLVTSGGPASCVGVEVEFERLPCCRQDESIERASGRSDSPRDPACKRIVDDLCEEALVCDEVLQHRHRRDGSWPTLASTSHCPFGEAPAASRAIPNREALFIDVDHFKRINDTLGHATGDRLLRQVAQRIKSAVREEDSVARLGGDEFIVVLPEVHQRADAEVVAGKIVQATAGPFFLDGQEIFVTVSIGVSVFPDEGEDAEELMRNADAAMYVAKEDGRGTVRVFTPELRERNHNRMRLETDLRHALERDQLTLCYQPLVDVRSGRILGAEALLRWFNPELGQISPQ